MFLKQGIAIVFAFVLCFNLSAPAFAAGSCQETHLHLLSTGYCSGNNVNVRTGPGTSYKSVGKANKGDAYGDYQTNRKDPGHWCHVHGKHIGWMYADYYTPVDPARVVEEKA